MYAPIYSKYELNAFSFRLKQVLEVIFLISVNSEYLRALNNVCVEST